MSDPVLLSRCLSEIDPLLSGIFRLSELVFPERLQRSFAGLFALRRTEIDSCRLLSSALCSFSYTFFLFVFMASIFPDGLFPPPPPLRVSAGGLKVNAVSQLAKPPTGRREKRSNRWKDGGTAEDGRLEERSWLC